MTSYAPVRAFQRIDTLKLDHIVAEMSLGHAATIVLDTIVALL